jgi:hypothetical protein
MIYEKQKPQRLVKRFPNVKFKIKDNGESRTIEIKEAVELSEKKKGDLDVYFSKLGYVKK